MRTFGIAHALWRDAKRLTHAEVLVKTFSRFARFSLSVLAAAGCGGSDSTSPPPGGNPDVWSTVSQRTWTMGADNEGYLCHAEQLTSDKYITGFRVAAPTGALATVYLAERDLPASTPDFACTYGTLVGSELIYAAGRGADSIKFTEGKGVHVAAGKWVLLMIHAHNTTSAPITVTTKIEGRVGTAATVTTPVDMVLAGTGTIQIPSDGLPHTADGGCSTTESSHIVAALPMQRLLGTHQKIDVMIGSATQTILDVDLDSAHVRFVQLGSNPSWPAASELKVQCTYVNNTGTVVHFGDAEDSALCFSAIYRYPAAGLSSTSPFECVTGVFDRAIDVPGPRAVRVRERSLRG